MKKLKVFLAVGLLCCGLSMSMAEAKTMTLDKTKVLVPQGFSVANDDLKFKKGTVVELNENNEVITGVLNRDIALRPTGWRNVINDYYEESNNSIFYPRIFHPFTSVSIPLPTYAHVRYKGNKPVTFATDGTVLSGTIDEEVTVSVNKDKYGLITFEDQYELGFYPDGSVKNGRLREGALLRPYGFKTGLVGDEMAGFVEFVGGKDISFSKEGYVTSGVLKKSISWQQPDGTMVTLPAKTMISFINGQARY